MVIAITTLFLGPGLFGCGEGKKKANSLFIHCGSSMSTPIQEIGKQFKEKFSINLEYNFAGNEALLPQIELTRKGDIFVCHDPYADLLAKKGLLEEEKVVGYLAPLLVVSKGNPKKITSLEDLTRPGLRVALGDPRFQTCAEMVHKRLKEKGIEDAVMKNVVLESRSHQELGNAIKLGAADAAVVWNFIAVMNSDALDPIWTEDKYQEIKVHVCLMSCSANKELGKKFLQFASSDDSKETFRKYGYKLWHVSNLLRN
jgi:molybdate transport system substrate-binding protein